MLLTLHFFYSAIRHSRGSQNCLWNTVKLFGHCLPSTWTLYCLNSHQTLGKVSHCFKCWTIIWGWMVSLWLVVWCRQSKRQCIVAENLCGGRFHTHLRDTFAPQVIRYVDLMESTIAQSLLKGYEKEKWDLKGYASLLTVGITRA